MELQNNGGQDMAAPWGAIINAVDNLFNRYENHWQFNQAYKHQKELMALQNQYNVDNWHMMFNETNAYNDPKAQRLRLEKAGYNPYIASGNLSNTSAPGGVASSSIPSAQNASSLGMHDIGMALDNWFALQADIRLKDKQGNKADKEADYYETLANKVRNDTPTVGNMGDVNYQNVQSDTGLNKAQTTSEEVHQQVMQAQMALYAVEKELKDVNLKWADELYKAELGQTIASAKELLSKGLTNKEEAAYYVASAMVAKAKEKGINLNTDELARTLESRVFNINAQNNLLGNRANQGFAENDKFGQFGSAPQYMSNQIIIPLKDLIKGEVQNAKDNLKNRGYKVEHKTMSRKEKVKIPSSASVKDNFTNFAKQKQICEDFRKLNPNLAHKSNGWIISTLYKRFFKK